MKIQVQIPDGPKVTTEVRVASLDDDTFAVEYQNEKLTVVEMDKSQLADGLNGAQRMTGAFDDGELTEAEALALVND